MKIRNAHPEDVPIILGLIRELAQYEKLLHEVTATEKQLEQALFADRPGAEVILAEWEGAVVGFALYFYNFSTFLAKPGIYLEDLFVKPDFRGHGIGKRLLTHLAKTAVKRGCGRFEWSVLDWNKDAIGFYKKLGAQPMDEWTVYRVTGKKLIELAKMA